MEMEPRPLHQVLNVGALTTQESPSFLVLIRVHYVSLVEFL